MTLLEISKLSVHLSGRPVLTDISLSLGAGELIGLIGANGAGKSTLLRGIAGLVDAAAGTIRFDGAPLGALDRRWLAGRLGFLPAGGQCHWPLSVAAVVALGREPHRRRWRGLDGDDRQAIAQAIAAADLEKLAGRPVTELSDGERARVMLARALAGTPKLLLADEPVANLDPHHRLGVMEQLAARARSGTGIVVALHDLTLAARYCPRLILLDHGRILADGGPERVLSAENLARAYGVEAKFGTPGEEFFVLPWRRLPRAGLGGRGES